jgi:hypothetical protein
MEVPNLASSGHTTTGRGMARFAKVSDVIVWPFYDPGNLVDYRHGTADD